MPDRPRAPMKDQSYRTVVNVANTTLDITLHRGQFFGANLNYRDRAGADDDES